MNVNFIWGYLGFICQCGVESHRKAGTEKIDTFIIPQGKISCPEAAKQLTGSTVKYVRKKTQRLYSNTLGKKKVLNRCIIVSKQSMQQSDRKHSKQHRCLSSPSSVQPKHKKVLNGFP